MSRRSHGLNFHAANLGHDTPVGFYPQGVSPDGIYDLAGNAFEWCIDGFGEYHCTVKANTGERLSSELNDRVVRVGVFEVSLMLCGQRLRAIRPKSMAHI